MSEDTASSSTPKSTKEDTAWWVATAETCVRITAAGFAGSLVGLAKERQEQDPRTSSAVVSVVRRAARRHGPIRTNLPVTWSLGCMVFVGVLESCRRSSPTSILLHQAPQISLLDNVRMNVPKAWSTPMAQQAVVTISDYGIGGTVAGLAGALARRTAFFSLTTTGFALGILAGIIQAASNAVEDHWVESSTGDAKDDGSNNQD